MIGSWRQASACSDVLWIDRWSSKTWDSQNTAFKDAFINLKFFFLTWGDMSAPGSTPFNLEDDQHQMICNWRWCHLLQPLDKENTWLHLQTKFCAESKNRHREDDCQALPGQGEQVLQNACFTKGLSDIPGQKAEDDIFLYFGNCPGCQLSVILEVVHLHFLHTEVIFIQSQVSDGVED